MMNDCKRISVAVILMCAWMAHGQQVDPNTGLPDDFPDIAVTQYLPDAMAEGMLFMSMAQSPPGIGHYIMILENDGSPVWYEDVGARTTDFKVLPNGFLHYNRFLEPLSFAGGGTVAHEILDADYRHRETIQAGNGFLAEAHDFQMLPNGHVLLLGYYLTEMDMSDIVPGGQPHAVVAGAVLQELDQDRHVVFQWRTWDHQSPEAYFQWLQDDPKARNPVVNAWHVNVIDLDYDGHLLIQTPAGGANLAHTSGWVKKIDRQTGQPIWHLGGAENEFTFVGISREEGIEAIAGHGFNRIANGNVLTYNNASADHTSRVYEFALDEVNRVATLVWSYRPPVSARGIARGNAQRLCNGNTLIGWGSPLSSPDATEVTADGQGVFDLDIVTPGAFTYRVTKSLWPPLPGISVAWHDLEAGRAYAFDDGDQVTGVTLEVAALSGTGNQVTVTRQPYAPVDPRFAGKSPLVLPIRVQMETAGIREMTAEIVFDATCFGRIDPLCFDHPSDLTVYQRRTPGTGEFSPLATQYNADTRQLSAATTGGGEFIFCYPDLVDVADLAPILNQVENDRGPQGERLIYPYRAEPDTVYPVNQEHPIFLSWTPQGFSRSHHLQVATDADFVNRVVDEPNLTQACYRFRTAEPSTAYHWRVNVSNEGGITPWSAGVFETVAPFVRVTAPNGAESWQRGEDVLIQWQDNLMEDVIIDLLKGDEVVETLGPVPSDRACAWEVPLGVEPGDDYTICIKSSMDETMIDASDNVFTIE